MSTKGLLFSSATIPGTWASTIPLAELFGPKGATLTTLPRHWTPEFVLFPWEMISQGPEKIVDQLTTEDLSGLEDFFARCENFILRSSVIGETIWQRGTYDSLVLSGFEKGKWRNVFVDAARKVVASASGKPVALVLQEYRKPVFLGEFGNLLRISKTRDHWEVSTVAHAKGTQHKTSLNTQRDKAADPEKPLTGPMKPSNPRSFGSIAAWINNELLLGESCRVNAEWIYDGERIFIVQLDEEGVDYAGVNPLQVRVPKMIQPLKQGSGFLRLPSEQEQRQWDKLIVLEQLSTAGEIVRPTLFFLPLEEVGGPDAEQLLMADFSEQIGPDEIIIRTSVKAGAEKITNLPRTVGLKPNEAAAWCMERVDELLREGADMADYAFVSHRFLASRASAWVRCDPADPNVEINANWGLPEALQFYPFDTIDVHVPTKNVSYYPDYKSHCVIPQDTGNWSHVRIKNEVARGQCISRAEAIDIAARSIEICKRLNEPCHIMWFIGCEYDDGTEFNLPWYWTKAHERLQNPDRLPPTAIQVTDKSQLPILAEELDELQHAAIELCPTNLDLMRDKGFLRDIAEISIQRNAPVLLSGSTLAHAYYLLQSEGCSVIAKRARTHTRVRNTASMGKLVRDKIPERISASQEHGITKRMPDAQVQNFLVSKLVEEALEFREASNTEDRLEELADAYEIIKTLVESSGQTVDSLTKVADKKRTKAGGFSDGLVLIETSIGERRDRNPTASVMPQRVSPDTIEIPFTCFGFMELEVPISLFLEEHLLWCQITLRKDRLVISLLPEGRQMDFGLEPE